MYKSGGKSFFKISTSTIKLSKVLFTVLSLIRHKERKADGESSKAHRNTSVLLNHWFIILENNNTGIHNNC